MTPFEEWWMLLSKVPYRSKEEIARLAFEEGARVGIGGPGPIIEDVRAALNDYYAALDRREHGGMAQHKAFCAIEKAMGMYWKPGESLKDKA